MHVVALLTLQAFCGLSVWVLDVDTTFVTDDDLPYEDLVLLVLTLEIPTNSDMEQLLGSQDNRKCTHSSSQNNYCNSNANEDQTV